MRISQQIFPRCVVLIGSYNKEGKENVMTASFVMPVSFEPKYVAFSISEERETFKNLSETKEFTLNLVSKEMRKIAEICGKYSGKEKDKFKLAGIEKEKGDIVKTPLVKESPISFECKVEEIKKFGDHFIVVGKVLKEHVRREDFKPLLHKTGKIFMEAIELKKKS
ncbi:MAG: flavin reductase family protein [Candidatus Aenigmatarchaeota archaeon]